MQIGSGPDYDRKIYFEAPPSLSVSADGLGKNIIKKEKGILSTIGFSK
ncbi:hypothetical protein [Legionella steelei]|nr:hypothetical protein [Legionella steelei]